VGVGPPADSTYETVRRCGGAQALARVRLRVCVCEGKERVRASAREKGIHMDAHVCKACARRV
jgi:hypothetical protein